MEDETPVKKRRKPDKRSRERQAFEGFTQEDVNKYFCMPNMAIDIIAEIDSLAELKVVLYIMRHTWGFHEYEGDKRITVDEFMYGRKSNGKRMDAGTRLSEMSVRNGLDLAEKHGYILSHIDDKDKAKVKKSYELHVKCGVKILDPTRKTGVKILESGVQKLYPAQAQKGKDFRPGSEKDRKETHQKKEGSISSLSKFERQHPTKSSSQAASDVPTDITDNTNKDTDENTSSSHQKAGKPYWLTKPIKDMTLKYGVYETSGEYIDQVYTLYQKAKSSGMAVVDFRTFFENAIVTGNREGIERFFAEMDKLSLEESNV